MTEQQARLGKRQVWMLCGVLIALLVPAYFNIFVQDDAYITFRYAENWVNGHGLVWNAGDPERLEGYTNFLWLLLIAGGMLLQLDPAVWSTVLGMLAGFGSLAMTAWLTHQLTGRYWASLLSVVLLGTNYSFSAYITGGLETQLQTCLVLGAATAAFHLTHQTCTRPLAVAVVMSVACALAFMTRMDSAIIGIILLAYVFCFLAWGGIQPSVGRVKLAAALLVPGAVIATLWLGWKLHYYGDVFPNTFYVKAAQTLSLKQGMRYTWLFYMSYGLLPVLLFCLCKIKSLYRSSAFNLALLACILLWTLYAIKVSGDFMEFRFYIPILPFMYCLLVWVLTQLAVWRRVLISGLLLVLSVLHATTFVGAFEIESITSLRHNVSPHHRNWIGAGKALKAAFGELEQPPKIAVTAAGAIPYYSGLPTLDLLGLNDAWIARNGIVIGARPGHTRFSTAAYLMETGVDLIVGHPRIVPLAAAPSTTAANFFPLCARGLASAKRMQVLQIPLDHHVRLEVLWVTDHSGIASLVEAGKLLATEVLLLEPEKVLYPASLCS